MVLYCLLADAQQCGMLLPLRGVATPGHGEGEGSAGDKFRVSGTQETVEGAGANEVSGVLSEASCCRCGAPIIKKRRGRPFLVDLFWYWVGESNSYYKIENLGY